MENLTPVEIVNVFNRYVHGQELAKKMLAIALRNRVRVALLPLGERNSVRKQNLLLLGPTGCGKTALMRVLKTQFGLPVLEQDMTGFSETGYVGRNLNTVGTDLQTLTRTIALPDWYVEMRTGMQLEKDEQRYTREELKALEEKEYEVESAARQAEWEAGRDAKKQHEQTLKDLGVFPDDDTYNHYRMVYYMRAFLVGYHALKNLPYDVIDFADIEMIHGQKLIDVAKTVVGLVEKMAGRPINSIDDLNEDLSDRTDEMMENNPALLGEFMGLMAYNEVLEAIMELGTDRLSSNPVAACVSSGDWYDVAHSFDEADERDIPPGIAWRPMDFTEFALYICVMLVRDPEGLEEVFEDCDDFTRFADKKLWSYTVPKPEVVQPKGKRNVLSKKDLDKVANCNGRDFVENFGVVFLDEIDKLIETDTTGRTHVSRSGVQRSLLKMVEGGLYAGIDTTNILFIGAGSFAEAPVTKLMPELQGRFTLRAEMEPLDKEAMIAICRMDSSEFHAMVRLLRIEGVKVNYDLDTFEYIAEKTVEANSVDDLGARRLAAIVEALFQDALYEPNKYTDKGYDLTGQNLRK
ncbi:putative DnaA protein [Salmonella phage pSal-SNUABM-04]|nr:putative DnaA protein [Salmonella phage pSal-SNUABM-04]